jgi:hypothetical protein
MVNPFMGPARLDMGTRGIEDDLYGALSTGIADRILL